MIGYKIAFITPRNSLCIEGIVLYYNKLENAFIDAIRNCEGFGIETTIVR